MTHTRIREPHHKQKTKPPQFTSEQITQWRKRLRDGLKNKDLAKELGIGTSRLSDILSNDAYDF